jgi:short-subunit dehydrogenase
MVRYKDRTALVTGASSGIGAAYARALAARGAHVVLVARSVDKLEALAAELSRRYGVRADVVPADLSLPGAAHQVFEDVRARGLHVDVLVNNAGFASYGRFETLAHGRQHAAIMLNVAGLVEMTHAFLPAMIARGDGVVVNVASTAAFQPLPYMAVYGASKAFVLSFSEALWAENRERGIRVLALCPGATETPFFDVVQAKEASVGRRESPDRVVDRAFRAVDRGRCSVVSGTGNCILANAGRVLPRSVVAAASARVLRPRSAEASSALPPAR